MVSGPLNRSAATTKNPTQPTLPAFCTTPNIIIIWCRQTRFNDCFWHSICKIINWRVPTLWIQREKRRYLMNIGEEHPADVDDLSQDRCNSQQIICAYVVARIIQRRRGRSTRHVRLTLRSAGDWNPAERYSVELDDAAASISLPISSSFDFHFSFLSYPHIYKKKIYIYIYSIYIYSNQVKYWLNPFISSKLRNWETEKLRRNQVGGCWTRDGNVSGLFHLRQHPRRIDTYVPPSVCVCV